MYQMTQQEYETYIKATTFEAIEETGFPRIENIPIYGLASSMLRCSYNRARQRLRQQVIP